MWKGREKGKERVIEGGKYIQSTSYAGMAISQ
jgi:hypothetical protein